MGWLKYFSIFLVCFVSIISTEEYVPVLLWGNVLSRVSEPKVPALQRITTEQFSDYMLKKIDSPVGKKPLILVFMEENLSVEDFSWRNEDDEMSFPMMQNLSQRIGGVTMLPSVENPHRSLKRLQKIGYTWQVYNEDDPEFPKGSVVSVRLEEPSYLDDRPDMLRKHDQQIFNVVSKALRVHKDVVAIYTARHSSWMYGAESNRVKREDPVPPAEKALQISDSTMTFMIYVKDAIIFKESGKEVKLTTFMSASLNNIEGGKELDVKIQDDSGNAYDFDFKFIGDGNSTAFTLNSIVNENGKEEFFSSPTIYAPRGYSYFCSETVVFKNKENSLTFKGLQVQAFVPNKQFGRPIDCTPWFSIPIWSGLLVILLLGAITAWGMMMIMDINTNDRFDDPKGKTITISAAD